MREFFLCILSVLLVYCEGFLVIPNQISHNSICGKCRTSQNRRLLMSVDIDNKAEKKVLFEGNPIGKALWDWTWEQDFMKPSQAGTSPTSFGDAATVLRNNIEQVYGGAPSVDGAPIAEGEVKGMLEGSLFLGLQSYYQKFGGVYKLLFGPKS
jgi:hypothetical protein